MSSRFYFNWNVLPIDVEDLNILSAPLFQEIRSAPITESKFMILLTWISVYAIDNILNNVWWEDFIYNIWLNTRILKNPIPCFVITIFESYPRVREIINMSWVESEIWDNINYILLLNLVIHKELCSMVIPLHLKLIILIYSFMILARVNIMNVNEVYGSNIDCLKSLQSIVLILLNLHIFLDIEGIHSIK